MMGLIYPWVRIQARIGHDAVDEVIRNGGDAVDTAEPLVKAGRIRTGHWHLLYSRFAPLHVPPRDHVLCNVRIVHPVSAKGQKRTLRASRSVDGTFSLRQELCRIPSIVKLMPSALWFVFR